jgi:hypothetical protein
MIYIFHLNVVSGFKNREEMNTPGNFHIIYILIQDAM